MTQLFYEASQILPATCLGKLIIFRLKGNQDNSVKTALLRHSSDYSKMTQRHTCPWITSPLRKSGGYKTDSQRYTINLTDEQRKAFDH